MTEAQINEVLAAFDALFDGMTDAESDALMVKAEDNMSPALRARFEAVFAEPEFDAVAMNQIMLEAIQDVI